MTNNKLDEIIKSDISISNPVPSDVTFDKILIIVPEPTSKANKMKATTAISKAEDLVDYGFATSDDAYKAAVVAFAQNPRPDDVLVCIRKNTTPESSATYENVSETLKRALSEKPFYGFHITSFKEAADVKAAAAWAEENEKLFGFEFADVSSIPVTNFNFFRSFGMYSGTADGYGTESQPEENKFAALALMAKCFGYKAGTETWHLKELKLVTPSVLTTEQKNTLASKNINSYLRYANVNCSIGGKTLGGEWIDVIRFADWLKAKIQINAFNALRQNPKLPFTDAGIGLIEGAVLSALSEGTSVGGISPTEFDDDGNEIAGYTVKMPRALDFEEGARKTRKLTGCEYTARLAGAIHLVEIKGHLTF